MNHQYRALTQASAPRSRAYELGKYGRLFPWLPPQAPDNEDMRAKMMQLANLSMEPSKSPGTNSEKPAGYTYLGQFIAHDLTFDPTSIKERQVDPEQLNNFRTPALDLDSIYGGGPTVTPYFYDINEDGYRTRFFLSKVDISKQRTTNPPPFYDVPRLESGLAVIADPRNDENLFVSQLHVAFLYLHNYFEKELSENFKGEARFLEAQRLLRWHYQYVILHDYLKTVLDPIVVKNAMPELSKNHVHPNLKYFYWRNEPFIPLEFSGAVFRFGHSQVREIYRMHDGSEISVFEKKEGDRPTNYVSWEDFFEGVPRNKFRQIDQKLAESLFKIPGLPGKPEINLAYQNLVRGLILQLPSGQSIARAMGLKESILDPEKLIRLGLDLDFAKNTPLWYYILLEANFAGGQHLGPVGSQIIAEVIIGMIQGDKTSYLNHDPKWVPEIKNEQGEKREKQDFTMVDLLQLAHIYKGTLVQKESNPS